MRRSLMTSRPFGNAGESGIATLGTVTNNAFTGYQEVGWAFAVGGAGITVSALRVHSYDTRTVTATLWTMGGAVLGRVDIAATANAWRQAAITPVALSSGTTYVVSLSQPGTDGYNSVAPSSCTFSPKITFSAARYTSSSGAFPASNAGTGVLYGLADIIIT